MFKQIVLWIVMMCLGGVVMYYSWHIVDFLWRSAWAEEHLWGTKNGVILLWLLLFIAGWLTLFGVVPMSDPLDAIDTAI